MSEAFQHHRTVHLSETDLDLPMAYCPVCLGTRQRKFVLRLQENPEVDYLECPVCRACSVSRMPAQNYLNHYYANYYGEDNELVTFQGINRFSQHVINSLKPVKTSRALSILDFGGGDGRLAKGIAREWLKTHSGKISITVVDFVEPQPDDNESISISHARSLDQIEGKFDLVLASAVFEHIPDLHKALLQTFELMAHGGSLYARTPYAIPFKKLIARFDIYFPMHVHDLGSAFWNHLLASLNLKGHLLFSRPSIVATDFTANPFQNIVAHLFKFPARLECFLRGRAPDRLLWPYVGGWEVVIRKVGKEGVA